ncbi:phosphoadenylyl-sulfate reductase [Candidimonas nitroreducens]|uniref:Adenosine 5'-phosphosulfate reductase n=1 Tax=Candidimonas nitroreducens TaxID=683354 RepID=A0A225MAY1_9BURK|nr:phosphoadenylyl-sulfate reductase [Candidimonas nitroreducens]OWT58427.1 phosphoadenosine phosphosulfate reductase [Candidimonas nitroreducens]
MAQPLAALWAALVERVAAIGASHSDAVFASSLAAEDMLLLHAIACAHAPIEVFTLDTGRLHAETLGMVDVIAQRYGIQVRRVRPDAAAVREHVRQHGEYAFYESLELRKACCGIRKVEPLRRALAGRSAWLTGQRREQSTTRAELPESEFDTVFGLQKYNPLAAWTQQQLWDAIRGLDIPYNPLHDQGYPSIGCEPCTRAVRPGEDVRAGRWWWEQRDSRECGLHAGNLAPAGAPGAAAAPEVQATGLTDAAGGAASGPAAAAASHKAATQHQGI